MAVEDHFTPLPIRQLSSANLNLISSTTNRIAGIRMGWVENNYPGTDPIVSFGGIAESNLRPPAMIAFGLAVLIATGSHDSATSGYSDAAVKEQVIRLVSSFTNTHAANGGNWGGVPVAANEVITPDSSAPYWQGALWVACISVAARLLWEDLSSAQRSAVTAMTQLEADRFLEYTVPYSRSRFGSIVYGDTKGEENAWNAWILMLASAWWPENANSETWLSKGLELILSASATPLFPTSKRPHNGLFGWALNGGSNIELNGSVSNHNINPHPNYMASVTTQCAVNCLTFAWLRRKLPSAGQVHGLHRIYRAMMDEPYSGFPSPGTIYDKAGGTSTINWPSGDDGLAGIQQAFSMMDALAHITGIDVTASISADSWLTIHAQQQSVQQQTNPSLWSSYGDLFSGAWMLLADWIVRNTSITVSNDQVSELLSE